MGASKRVTGALRRAVTGVRSALPGGADAAADPVEPASGAPVSAVAGREGSGGKSSVSRSASDQTAATKTPKTPSATQSEANRSTSAKGSERRAATAKKPTTSTKSAQAEAAATSTTAPSGATRAKRSTPAQGATPAKKATPAKGATPAQKATPTVKGAGSKGAPVKAAAGEPQAPGPALESAVQEPTPSSPPAIATAAWTPEELTGFRAALEAEVARLTEELHMGEADLADLISDSGEGAGDDQADAGAKTFEREHEMSVNANTREMLDQAIRARQRLEAGTYGICESCGNPIPAGRLRAFPRATLCVTCKQAEERR
jgi:RNA polymerase-binding transcription factor DksA